LPFGANTTPSSETRCPSLFSVVLQFSNVTIFVSRDDGGGSAEVPPFFEPVCTAIGAEFPDAIFWLAIAAALRFREGAGTVEVVGKAAVLAMLISLFRAFQPLLVAAARFDSAGAGDCGESSGSGLRGSSSDGDRLGSRGGMLAWFAISKSISTSSA
jgi:hypothetical protein